MPAKDSQAEKAQTPTAVTESGIVMLDKDLHPAKALPTMVGTESGILMLFKELQS